MHIDGDHGGPLFDRQPHQRLPDHDRGLDAVGSISQWPAILGEQCGRETAAPRAIQAGVDNDPV